MGPFIPSPFWCDPSFTPTYKALPVGPFHPVMGPYPRELPSPSRGFVCGQRRLWKPLHVCVCVRVSRQLCFRVASIKQVCQHRQQRIAHDASTRVSRQRAPV